jgi:hypothetical protein
VSAYRSPGLGHQNVAGRPVLIATTPRPVLLPSPPPVPLRTLSRDCTATPGDGQRCSRAVVEDGGQLESRLKQYRYPQSKEQGQSGLGAAPGTERLKEQCCEVSHHISV